MIDIILLPKSIYLWIWFLSLLSLPALVFFVIINEKIKKRPMKKNTKKEILILLFFLFLLTLIKSSQNTVLSVREIKCDNDNGIISIKTSMESVYYKKKIFFFLENSDFFGINVRIKFLFDEKYFYSAEMNKIKAKKIIDKLHECANFLYEYPTK